MKLNFHMLWIRKIIVTNSIIKFKVSYHIKLLIKSMLKFLLNLSKTDLQYSTILKWANSTVDINLISSSDKFSTGLTNSKTVNITRLFKFDVQIFAQSKTRYFPNLNFALKSNLLSTK